MKLYVGGAYKTYVAVNVVFVAENVVNAQIGSFRLCTLPSLFFVAHRADYGVELKVEKYTLIDLWLKIGLSE